MTSINPTKLILGILTPFISAGSAWLAAAVAKYGIHLDPAGINALGIAGATVGAAAMVKLIHDVEHIAGVQRVVHVVDANATPVMKAIETADPAAKATVDDAIVQAKLELQAQFNDLVAKLPQLPAASAPAPAAPATPPAAA